MDIQKIQNQVLKAEGHAEGLMSGVRAMANWIVQELELEKKAAAEKAPAEENKA